ncbi:TetR/AcrR family transcriptional regulator [Conexibacter sp. SYSU D00693]|uniref:TetR/AcrR family transcriptional regulator n=1 Tax=Conexibacter sp. SYSU D00693 TaxID=2812560 RepID=UPI00196AB546|nr:TetR/AcrR family transcriptional regulator [Conexibacter sp. SYSU D00693]
MAATAPRSYHHGNLRAELLAHAEEALRAGGLADLSLRELARRAGVSHAAPRRHFADKQALFDALAQEGFERLGREMEDADPGGQAPWRDRLAAFARAYVTFATRDAALLDLMFAGKHRPDVPPGVREAADRAFGRPLELIAAGQAAGAVEAGDPREVSLFAFAALQGLAALSTSDMLSGAGFTVDDVLDGVVDRLVRALAP